MFNETYRYLLTHGIDFADILKPIWNKGGGWEKSNCKTFYHKLKYEFDTGEEVKII